MSTAKLLIETLRSAHCVADLYAWRSLGAGEVSKIIETARKETANADVIPSQSVKEALWILAEHNSLKFGENHNTTIIARAVLAALDSQLPALLQAYEDGAFNRGEGEDYGGHKLLEARSAVHAFLGLPE